jgi:signal transduction histidine kinase
MQNKNILNIFTLQFTDKLSEVDYLRKNNKHRRLLNIIMIITILVFSVVNSFMYSLVKFENESNDYKVFTKTTSYVIIGIFMILLIISVVYKSLKAHYWISMLGFYFLLFTNMLFRVFFLNLQVDYYVFSIIYSVQLLYRLSWLYFGLIDFKEYIILVIILTVSNWGYAAYFTPLYLHFRFSLNSILGIISCVMAYFYILEKRKSFYYNRRSNKLNRWYKNFLDNTSNGFIRIYNEKINMVNNTMAKILLTNSDICDAYNLETQFQEFKNEMPFLIKNTSLVLEQLLRNITYDNDYYNTLVGDRFSVLIRFLEENTKKEKFCPVGIIEFNSLEDPIYFEVFGRYYLASIEDGLYAHNYELTFNNVTNIKATEGANAEMKYKTIFLSKVAHEFKNPLLCIKELVNQLSDNLDKGNIDSMQDLLSNIKSMSDYLIILIKDMDYFSRKSINNTRMIALDKDNVNMIDLINFCHGVTFTLLKKFQKEERVKFKVEQINVPGYIYTDESKLKQILINLLSNSVKCTMHGSIVLKILGYDDKLQFRISDTGIGIKDEIKQNLFKPFVRPNLDNNGIGSGLGLSIVKDLLEALDSQIGYETSSDRGTSFIFTIKYEQANKLNNQLNVSGITEVNEFEPVACYESIKNFIRIPNKEEDNLTVNKKVLFVVDDEVTTRKSTIRLLRQYFSKSNLDIDIIESCDGIECLYNYYTSLINGKKVSLIISDQTMTFMNGTTCAEILFKIANSNGYRQVPFVILTAYELSTINIKNYILDVVTKPLTNNTIEKLMTYIL